MNRLVILYGVSFIDSQHCGPSRIFLFLDQALLDDVHRKSIQTERVARQTAPPEYTYHTYMACQCWYIGYRTRKYDTDKQQQTIVLDTISIFDTSRLSFGVCIQNTGVAMGSRAIKHILHDIWCVRCFVWIAVYRNVREDI